MRLFAVRVKQDRQAVGLFWTDSLGDLWWMVDHVCDPGFCEYHPIDRPAALIVEGDNDPPFGVERKMDEAGNVIGTDLAKLLTPEFALHDYFYEDIKEGWKALPYFDEPGGGAELLLKEIAESET